MFRRLLCMASVALLLCGCSAVRSPEETAAAVRDVYAAASDIEIVTGITSNLNEETMDYTIGYSYQKQGDTASAVMTVLAPESIAGITAEISGDDFTFSYEDTELETAMPDHKGLTPVDATTYLLYDLMHSVPEQVWQEGEMLALRYESKTEEGNVVKEAYLHPDSCALAEARIYNNGNQILRCTFETCTLDGK